MRQKQKEYVENKKRKTGNYKYVCSLLHMYVLQGFFQDFAQQGGKKRYYSILGGKDLSVATYTFVIFKGASQSQGGKPEPRGQMLPPPPWKKPWYIYIVYHDCIISQYVVGSKATMQCYKPWVYKWL